MRIRLLLAGMFMIALPMCFSPSKSDKLTKPTPFGTVALPGHTIIGDRCECGAPGCICDPGEEPRAQSAHPEGDKTKTPKRHAASVGTDRGVEFAFGTGALVLVLALLVWSRSRA